MGSLNSGAMNMKKNKLKAFTLLEVLFAIVIFSATASSIFIFMKHLIKTSQRIHKRAKDAETMSIIFSEHNQVFSQEPTEGLHGERKYKKTPTSVPPIKQLERIFMPPSSSEPESSGGLLFVSP